MKITTYDSREEWLGARKGKITGSRLKDIIVKRGTGRKKGFYELIAERLVIEESTENPMERGNRLEKEALARFSETTSKQLNTDLVIWQSDENPDIAISPDAFVEGKKVTEAVEVKCLNTATHLEAYLTNEIPDEYRCQAIQYFIVNNDLNTLYMVFFDPRLAHTAIECFHLTITRDMLLEEITTHKQYEIDALKEVEAIVAKLTF
jgi:putative phage-type endonuclease